MVQEYVDNWGLLLVGWIALQVLECMMTECWQEVLLQLMGSWVQLWCVRRTFGVAQVAQHQW